MDRVRLVEVIVPPPCLPLALLAALLSPPSSDGGIVRIPFAPPLPGEASVHSAVGPDGALTLELAPHSVRAVHHRLLTDVDGVTIESDAPPSRTLRGVVHATGFPRLDGARVAASRIDGGLHGIALAGDGSLFEVRTEDGGTLAFVPPEERDPSGLAARCEAATVHATSGPSPQIAASVLGSRAVEVAVEIDHGLVVQLGSVPAAIADVEAILGAAGLIFETQLDLRLQVVATVVPGQPQYAPVSAADFLDQLRARWESSLSAIERDVVQHFGAVWFFPDGLIGAAQVAGICSPEHYSWVAASFYSLPLRTQITAHELGHLLGAKHCNATPECGIMCASIGGCESIDQFGPTTKGQLAAYLATVPCLHVPPGPVTPPFVETFPGKKPNPAIWSSTTKASGQAAGEPSPKRAARLRGSLLERILTSHQFDLHFTADPWLTFRAQARGVEAGEALVVERLDATAAWIEIGRVVADGTTRDVFSRHALPLVGLPGTDDANVRFRAEVSDEKDVWYVDDVRVAEKAALVGDAPRLGEKDGAIVNRGDPTDDLPWTVSAAAGAPWLAPAETSGVLLAAETAAPIEALVDPSGLAEGLHVGELIVTSAAAAGESFRLPVSALVSDAPTFVPGDRLEATLDGTAGRSHVAAFVASPGEKLVLSLDKEKKLVGPTIRVAGPDGLDLATFAFAKFKKAKKKASVKIVAAGLHRITIAEAAGADGPVAVLTARKLPKSGKPYDGKKKPKGTGAVMRDVLVPWGGRVSVTAAPLGAIPTPFSLTVLDPAGEALDTAAWTSTLVEGGVVLEEYPVATPGLHRLVVGDLVGAGAIALTVDPRAPPAGTSVVAMAPLPVP